MCTRVLTTCQSLRHKDVCKNKRLVYVVQHYYCRVSLSGRGQHNSLRQGVELLLDQPFDLVLLIVVPGRKELNRAHYTAGLAAGAQSPPLHNITLG